MRVLPAARYLIMSVRIQDFSKFRDMNLVQPTRVQLSIPAFTLPVPSWHGASDLLVEYALNNVDYKLALRTPLRKFGSNFVVAIRWKEDDIYYRFVFWSDPLAVLFFPLYDGETIGLNATIEIWSVNSSSAPTSPGVVLESSQLVFPVNSCQSCCIVPLQVITLVATGPIVLPPGVCNPFCACDTPPGTGACIIGTDCSITTKALCLAAGGVYQGDGSSCPVVPPYELPAWPVPTPYVCGGRGIYGPMYITDPVTSDVTTPGINPGASDPLTYIATWGPPGCLEAWAAAVWADFIAHGPAFSSARLIWADSHTAGYDFMALQVFPSLTGPYAHVIDLDTKIQVEYCPT